jgi:hypothetical protein
MNLPDKVLIGVNHRGLACYASPALIAEKGEIEVARRMGLEIRRYPVKMDLSGNIVMVDSKSHEDAIGRSTIKKAKGEDI